MRDVELLDRYRQGSHEAFAELVRRHIDWVYSAARRRVRDEHLADDVCQASFLVLAKKPPRLKGGQTLSAWLFGVVAHVSMRAVRTEVRRRCRETEAAKMRSQTGPSESEQWEAIAPDLDELIDRLRYADRQALILRFYEQRSIAELAISLGIAEPAARKRVSRAIERLRDILARKGVTIPCAALAGVLLAHAITPAPAAMASMIAGSSLAAGPSAALADGVIAMLKANTLKFATATAAGAVITLLGLIIIATVIAQSNRPTSASAPAVPATIAATKPATPPFDEAAARTAILKRFEALQNLTATYRSEENTSGRPALSARGSENARGGAGPISSTADASFSLLSRNLRMQQARDATNGLENPAISRIDTVSVIHGESFDSWTIATRDGKQTYSGNLDQRLTGFRLPLLIALGLSGQSTIPLSPQGPLLSEEDLKQMKISLTPEGRVTLSRESPQEEWEFRPDMGYAISRYRTPGPGMTVDMQPGDFRAVNGLMLPFLVHMTTGSTISTVLLRTEVTVKELKVNDPENTEARYRPPVWPEGTQLKVGKQATKVNYIVGKEGELISLDALEVAKFKDVAKVATTRPNVAGDQFSDSIISVVLNDIQVNREASLLHLATGKLGRSPAPRGQFNLLMRHQLDGAWKLGGMTGTLLFKLPSDKWKENFPTAIRDAITAGDPGVKISFLSNTEIDYWLGHDPQTPIVFAYFTPDGDMGMLRITEFKTDQAHIEIKRIERTEGKE